MKRTTTYASRAIFSALALASFGVSAIAQQPDAAPAQTQAPEAKTEAPAFKPSVPKVSGLINVRYTYNSDDATPNSFDIRRLRLAVSGDISPKIDYKFQTEYETSVKVIDAFVRFKPAKAFNVQVGEFKVAYSQETQDGPAKWITIENPSVVGKLNGYSDISGLKANGRDVGVRFYGSTGAREGFDIFTYRVGVYNGNGINVKDADEHKDVSLYAAFSPVKALTISAAQYFGKYAGAKRDRTSAGVTLKQGGLYVRSEYLHGQTGDVKHQGVYVTAAYKLPIGIQPLISYDVFNKDTDADRDVESNWQVGFNWHINKLLRTQVAYTRKTFVHSAKDGTDLLEAQLLLSF